MKESQYTNSDLFFRSPAAVAVSDCDAATAPPKACGVRLTPVRDVKRHVTKCQPDDASSKNFDDVANLTTKTCTECSLAFGTRTQLKKHVDDVHKIKAKRHRRRKEEILTKFYCDVCNRGFTRKYDMEKHRSRGHALMKRETKQEKTKNVEVLKRCRNEDPDGRVHYRCDFCGRSFAQSYNLTRHRSIHTGVREFCCHICGVGFRVMGGLNRHIQTYHYQVRNYGCEVCKKTFTTRSNRDEHMNIHTDTRPFVCDVCGKSFRQRASLHVHKMFHTDEYRFECSYCGKKFRRNQDLKVHRWLHTGHKPYACDKCKATFRLRHDLTRHLKIHDKPGECVCDVCGSVFSQERYLKVHRKIHVDVQTPPKAEDVQVKQESKNIA